MSNDKNPKPAPIHHVYDWISLSPWIFAARTSAADSLAKLLDSREMNNSSFASVDLREKDQELYGNPFAPDDLAWLRAEFGDDLHLHYWW